MKLILALLALFLGLGAPASAAPRAWRSGDALDQVLVQWRQGLSRAELQAEAARLGLAGAKADPIAYWHGRAGALSLQRTALLDIDIVRLPSGLDGAALDRVLDHYRSSPLVQAAEPDAPIRQAALPNDPAYSAGGQWSLGAANWTPAWNAYPASLAFNTVITVAVLDTGVDAHPDLTAQLLSGQSFSASESTTDDRNGHGTFVAGLIAATPNNGQGIAGAFIAPAYVRILPVKVLNVCGDGTYASVTQGILYAVQQGARVLNLSLTGLSESDIMREAVVEAGRRGAVVIAAAGNDYGEVSYPAAYASVISVAALDSAGTPAGYSNRGKVEISAPGGNGSATCACASAVAGCSGELWSLTALQPGCPSRSNPACAFADRLEGGAGTSFAAPLVAATAAMLLAREPGLQPHQVQQRLLQSAAPTTLGAGYNGRAGWGKLDIHKALSLSGSSGPGSALRVYNWPNPFSPERDGGTQFSFFLPQAQAAELRLLDAGGDLVRRWSIGAAEAYAGMNIVRWDGLNGSGRPAANGGYVLVLESGGERARHRVALLR